MHETGKKLTKKFPKTTYFMRQIKQQNQLITAMFIWILFLVYEVTIRSYDLYRTFPSVDVASHFLAGMAMAATLYWLINKYSNKSLLKHPYWFIITGTFVISMAWEVAESIQEIFFYNPPHLLDFYFWDGVFDIIFAIVGAILFLLIKARDKKGN